jgi:hydroxymethylglutaryl-CoA lyase
MSSAITLVECPRDAMQGWQHFIPTADKVSYLNKLLQVGFDVLDFGSFVSAKAIPQLADTAEIIPQLDLSNTNTQLLAIIANLRGANDAVQFDEISFLGFPFSISETFQKRNTNKSIAESVAELEEIQRVCLSRGKSLVVYLSMGFGNPYGDPYSPEIAGEWVKKLVDMGIKTIALSDTVGVASKEDIRQQFEHLIPLYPEVEFGAHLHASAERLEDKINAAYDAGCRRFDSAMKGIGGCPMAKDDLVGNIATERLVAWCDQKGIAPKMNRDAFNAALDMAPSIFI